MFYLLKILFLLLQIKPSADRWLTNETTVFDPVPASNTSGGPWVHIILLVSFTMLVVLRVYDFRRIALLIQGFVRPAAVSSLYREESALTSRVSVFLLLNFLLMASLFIWQSSSYYFEKPPAPSSVAWIALILVGVYLTKIITTRFLGFLFEVRDSAREYMYNIILFNKTAGLILFPVVLLLAYARQIPQEWLITIGAGLWVLTLVYRVVRLSFIGFSVRGVSLFYIILYLCTLEILPVLVIYKLLVKQN